MSIIATCKQVICPDSQWDLDSSILFGVCVCTTLLICWLHCVIGFKKYLVPFDHH